MTFCVLRAVLRSARHPEYGQITVPFPVSNDDYELVMERLEELGMGDVLAQDCRIEALDSGCPVLRRLEGTLVNVDELDLLARQLDSCDEREMAQFQGMAEVLRLSDIVDLINLTFSCQSATVITDFSDLEEIGRQHRMDLNGGCLTEEDRQRMDGRKEALDLLQSGKGVFTPYGLVYDNGMELKPLYDRRHFPAYLYDQSLLVLEGETAVVSLPMPDRRLDRVLAREEPQDMRIVMNNLPQRITDLLCLEREDLHTLNAFCQRFRQIQQDGMEQTYCAALLAECVGTLSEALAIDVDDYELVPEEAEKYGKDVLRRLGADEEVIDTIDGYMDFARLGSDMMEEDGVRQTAFGPVRRLSRPFPTGP